MLKPPWRQFGSPRADGEYLAMVTYFLLTGISDLLAPDGTFIHPRAAERTKFCSAHNRPAPEAVTSAHADVEPTGAAAFRAFLRHRSTLVPFLRQPSLHSAARQPGRHRQRPDPPQHLAEEPPVQMTFRQQEPVVPGMLHQPAPSFYQPLLETRERPATVIAVNDEIFHTPVTSTPRLTYTYIRHELHGKNLACWCPLDQSCHADVLLAIANE